MEFDRELRAAAKREEAQFQNLRVGLSATNPFLVTTSNALRDLVELCCRNGTLQNKRAALEEKLQKLSISLREDCRIAKRVRYQVNRDEGCPRVSHCVMRHR